MRWLARTIGEVTASGPRAAWLRRAAGLFGLALVAATWRLWTPQDVFPQVPLVAAAGALPGWVEWLGLAGMLVGWCGALAAPAGRVATASLVLAAGSTAAMIVIDQERLQPWAYQFMLVALVLAWTEPRGAIVLVRLLVVSSYLHSGITKLDYAFLHTLGQQFLAALAGLGGGSLAHWSEGARLALAAVFPVGEIVIAAGLVFGPTRRAALAGAIALHVLLLAILGPWGLDHKPAVLVWNVYFIVQDVILFWQPRAAAAAAGEADAARARAPWPIVAMVLAAVVLPLAAPWSWYDLWPSWGLYAASAECVRLGVHRGARGELPAELAALVEEPADASDPWLVLRLDRWALDALQAPIYPQNRVQLGVAQAVIERYGLGHRARIVRYGLADRRTGEREFSVLAGPAQVEAALDEYFFNGRGRKNLR
jgi:hypothetical protein